MMTDHMSDPTSDPMDPNLPPNEPPLEDPNDPQRPAPGTSPQFPIDPTIEPGQDRSGMTAKDPDGSQMQREAEEGEAGLSDVSTRGTDPDLGQPDPRQF